MARSVQDREDLLRDATAFGTRVQLRVYRGPSAVEVFAGFRSQGAASFYFDQDPVYHFNNSGQFRRAFVDDVLITAERGRLVVLRRQGQDAAVTMLRQEMSAGQQQKFCESAASQLGALRQAISQGDFTVAGQISPAEDSDEDVVARLAAYLKQCDKFEVAASPHVVG